MKPRKWWKKKEKGNKNDEESEENPKGESQNMPLAK